MSIFAKNIYCFVVLSVAIAIFNGCSSQSNKEDFRNNAYHTLDSLLNYGNPLQQDRTIDILKTLPTQDSHKLLSDFAQKPGELQISAAFGLAALKDTSAFEKVLEATKSTNWLIQQTAVYSMRYFPAAKAFPVLEQSLNDKSMICRMAVVRALGDMNDLSTLPLLKKAALDSNLDVRKQAVRAILNIPGGTGVDYIKQQLVQPDKEKVNSIILILATAQDSISLPIFIGLAGSQDAYFRRFLAAKLEGSEDKTSLACLKDLYKDPDEMVRSRAFLSLVRLRAVENSSELTRFLKDSKSPFYWDALRITIELGDTAFYPVLQELYEAEKDQRNKTVLGVTLLRYNDSRAEQLIYQTMQDPKLYNVLDASFQAFAYVHNDLCIPFLIKASQIKSEILRERALRILGSFENEETIKYFEKISASEDLVMQRFAVEFFGNLAKKGNKKGIQFVLASLNHPNGAIREQAAFLSGTMCLKQALKPLAERLSGDQDVFVRMASAWAILNILQKTT